MMNGHTQINPSELHATIKLGIDARSSEFYVGRQLDGATPQPNPLYPRASGGVGAEGLKKGNPYQ